MSHSDQAIPSKDIDNFILYYLEYNPSLDCLELLSELLSATTENEDVSDKLFEKMYEVLLQRNKYSLFLLCADHPNRLGSIEWELRFLETGFKMMNENNEPLYSEWEKLERYLDLGGNKVRELLEPSIENSLKVVKDFEDNPAYDATQHRENALKLSLMHYRRTKDLTYFVHNCIRMLKSIQETEYGYGVSEILVNTLEVAIRNEVLKDMDGIIKLLTVHEIHSDWQSELNEIVSKYRRSTNE